MWCLRQMDIQTRAKDGQLDIEKKQSDIWFRWAEKEK